MTLRRGPALTAAALTAAFTFTTLGVGPAHAATSGTGDILGDGSTADIAVVDDTLRVTFADSSTQQTDLPAIESVSSHPNSIHLYDLDPVPGKEIVIDRGGDGSHHWYAVFTVRDGQVTWVNGPGDALDLAGGGWKLLAERSYAVVVCRDGGQISLATVTAGADDVALQDLAYSPPEQQVGDQSNYRPESDWRTVPADSVLRDLPESSMFACTDGLSDADDVSLFPN